MGAELPLCVVVTILECCVTFSGVKLSIRSFVLFIWPFLGDQFLQKSDAEYIHLCEHVMNLRQSNRINM